jgi:hypothetical protein
MAYRERIHAIQTAVLNPHLRARELLKASPGSIWSGPAAGENRFATLFSASCDFAPLNGKLHLSYNRVAANAFLSFCIESFRFRGVK